MHHLYVRMHKMCAHHTKAQEALRLAAMGPEERARVEQEKTQQKVLAAAVIHRKWSEIVTMKAAKASLARNNNTKSSHLFEEFGGPFALVQGALCMISMNKICPFCKPVCCAAGVLALPGICHPHATTMKP